MENFIYPLLALLVFPPLTLLPGLALGVWWIARGRGTWSGAWVALTALLWLAYSAWEISFMFRPVREWIRVDLLLIAPMLVALSLVSIIIMIRGRRRHP